MAGAFESFVFLVVAVLSRVEIDRKLSRQIDLIMMQVKVLSYFLPWPQNPRAPKRTNNMKTP